MLDATRRLLQREGYASINARRIAEEAGVKKQLVFYYFENMDELICETFANTVQEMRVSLARISDSKTPLRDLWRLRTHGPGRLLIEFTTIASHSETLRNQMKEYWATDGKLQDEILGATLARFDLPIGKLSPRAATFLLSSVVRNYLIEKELGIDDVGTEIDAFIEWSLDQLEPSDAASQ
jgi:AcrR family transcriptional regulator